MSFCPMPEAVAGGGGRGAGREQSAADASYPLAVFSRRLNAKGCLWALIVGLAVDLFGLAEDSPVRLLRDFSHAEGSFLWIVDNTFFQYYGILIMIVCGAIVLAVSCATGGAELGEDPGLTYGTRTAEDIRASRAGWNRYDVSASVAVLLVILAADLCFTG